MAQMCMHGTAVHICMAVCKSIATYMYRSACWRLTTQYLFESLVCQL